MLITLDDVKIISWSEHVSKAKLDEAIEVGEIITDISSDFTKGYVEGYGNLWIKFEVTNKEILEKIEKSK